MSKEEKDIEKEIEKGADDEAAAAATDGKKQPLMYGSSVAEGGSAGTRAGVADLEADAASPAGAR